MDKEFNKMLDEIEKRLIMEKESFKFIDKLDIDKINTLKFIEGKIEAYNSLKTWLTKNDTATKKIEMRKIGLSERKDVENLIRKNIGSLLESEETIVSKLGEGINIGIYDDKELIGYVLGSYDVVNELYGNETVLKKIEELGKKDELIFIISDLLVDKIYRKRGIGKRLLEEIVHNNESNINLLLGRNESNGKKWEAESISVKLGFTNFYKEKGFWNIVTVLEDYECKACIVGCNCEMLLTYLNKGELVFINEKDYKDLETVNDLK